MPKRDTYLEDPSKIRVKCPKCRKKADWFAVAYVHLNYHWYVKSTEPRERIVVWYCHGYLSDEELSRKITDEHSVWFYLDRDLVLY